jgi:Polyketide cyclase / dehydrase and lipid transport
MICVARSVDVAMTFPGSVEQAEACWYEVGGWPEWVDQLERVVSVAGDWPRPGAGVTWESAPAGRGAVRELVIWHEPGTGQQTEVTDDSIRGLQTVTFATSPEGVTVSLSLEYDLVKRSPVMFVVDLLFVRRVMTESLKKTLSRFGAQLASRRAATP